MTYYSDESYEIERDGRIFRMKLEYEEDPDTSFLGEYDKDARTFVVDRKAGFLYGDWEDEPEKPHEEDFSTDEEYDTAYAQWYEAWSEWHDKGEREILADVSSNYERNEYQYFRPYAGGLDPTDPETDLEEWTKYAVRDWERMYGLERGDWCFVGVVVQIDTPACSRCGHVKTLYASVWGIENDSKDSFFEEVRDDLISELQRELEKYQTA